MIFMVRMRAALCGALVFAAACGDSNPAATGPEPTLPGPAEAVAALRCAVDVRAGTLACRSAQPGTDAGVRSVILGGQGVNVRLASSGTAYDAGTGILRSDVTVENLTTQMLGTVDGALPDPAGVRVFFAAGPTVTDGTGTVAVANADGTGTFTAGGQSYMQYPGILAPGDTSAAKEWRFAVPSTVVAFTFTVYVAAPVPAESGWISLTPVAPSMTTGQSRRLLPVVRSVTGQPVAGAKVTWSLFSGDVAATVDSTGLITVQEVLNGQDWGTVEVTATSGARTGRVRVYVSKPGTAAVPAISAVSVSPALVENDGADSAVVRVEASHPFGVLQVEVDLEPSSQRETVRSCTATAPSSGTSAGGVFTCTFGFPAGAPGGVWKLRSVVVRAAGGTRVLDSFEIRDAGVPARFYVRGPVSDYIPPTLSSFTFSPDSVRTVFDTVTIDVAAVDADSGVAQVRTTFSDGATGPTLGCSARTPVSGTRHNGVFRCRMPVPGLVRSDFLEVLTVQITDGNGNITELFGHELADRGYPTRLKVQPDTVPPAVTAFSFTPGTVAANGADSVAVTLSGTDAWSGVQYLEVQLKRTGDGSPRNCIAGYPYAAGASRTLKCALRFDPGAEGTYRVDFIRVSDHAGRSVSLDATQAQAAGYPVELTVTP